MDYYLTHFTSLKNLEKILEDGYLFPLKKSGNEKNYLAKKYKNYSNQVFFQPIFPINKLLPIETNEYAWKPSSDIYLIFNYEKILDNPKIEKHFCSFWNYGKYSEFICSKYDNNSSPKENIDRWVSEFLPILRYRLNNFSENLYTEIVVEGDVSLSNLAYIYIHIDDSNEPFHYSLEDVNKIEELKKKYPEYEWRIKLPEIKPLSVTLNKDLISSIVDKGKK